MTALVKLIIRLYLMLFGLVVTVAVKLRLGLPLLYVILMATVFGDWSTEHNMLSIIILGAMVAVVACSWLVTGYRYITRNKVNLGSTTADVENARMLASQLNAARYQGYSLDD